VEPVVLQMAQMNIRVVAVGVVGLLKPLLLHQPPRTRMQ